MKKIMFIALSVLVLFPLLRAKSKMDYRFYDAQMKSSLTLSELADKLQNCDVVFFGELHDDILIHRLEAEILPFPLRAEL